jgi:fatty-acyl-CoA synthase
MIRHHHDGLAQTDRLRTPIEGLMQRQPLLLSTIIRHAARHHPDGEVVALVSPAQTDRSNYAQIERRSRRLARVLERLGVRFGNLVATLAWNNDRHRELYYAVSGMGAVCHAVNPRLAPDDVV